MCVTLLDRPPETVWFARYCNPQDCGSLEVKPAPRTRSELPAERPYDTPAGVQLRTPRAGMKIAPGSCEAKLAFSPRSAITL